MGHEKVIQYFPRIEVLTGLVGCPMPLVEPRKGECVCLRQFPHPPLGPTMGIATEISVRAAQCSLPIPANCDPHSVVVHGDEFD